MAYIPKSAKWYLADIVEQIAVEGDPRNIVHTNLVLIAAESPEEAYQKALDRGTEREQSYENLDGKKVAIRFRGLRDLNVIHDELGHGAELIYTEQLDMDESAILDWVSPKADLGVFRPVTPSTGPDYSSGDVVREVIRRLASPESR